MIPVPVSSGLKGETRKKMTMSRYYTYKLAIAATVYWLWCYGRPILWLLFFL